MEAVTDALRPFKAPGYPIAVQYGTFENVGSVDDELRAALDQQKAQQDAVNPTPAEAQRARKVLLELAEDEGESGEVRAMAAAAALGFQFG